MSIIIILLLTAMAKRWYKIQYIYRRVQPIARVSALHPLIQSRLNGISLCISTHDFQVQLKIKQSLSILVCSVFQLMRAIYICVRYLVWARHPFPPEWHSMQNFLSHTHLISFTYSRTAVCIWAPFIGASRTIERTLCAEVWPPLNDYIFRAINFP